MDILYENILLLFQNGGWQRMVMWLIGALLIFLAIKFDMEPTLLLPMGFGAIVVNIPALYEGALSTLFEAGIPMEQKPFSMGMRIEHKQSLIDLSQYGTQRPKGIPAADYKLAVHLPDGGSAYTFCMCPGGYVVAAASQEGRVVTNGMSYSDRGGENANSALLVTLKPEDFPDAHPLSGMLWQEEIEEKAFRMGGSNYRAPSQTVGEFLSDNGRESTVPVEPTYRPGVTSCNLSELYPEKITNTLKQAIVALDRQLKGFADPGAVLTAPETRSSSPVRIVRGEDLQSSLRGLYPCGEGAGYAGGIMSAAVDGMLCAESLIKNRG